MHTGTIHFAIRFHWDWMSAPTTGDHVQNQPVSFSEYVSAGYFVSSSFFLLSRLGGGPIGSKFFNNGTLSF